MDVFSSASADVSHSIITTYCASSATHCRYIISSLGTNHIHYALLNCFPRVMGGRDHSSGQCRWRYRWIQGCRSWANWLLVSKVCILVWRYAYLHQNKPQYGSSNCWQCYLWTTLESCFQLPRTGETIIFLLCNFLQELLLRTAYMNSMNIRCS